jgi:hypothetical protein
VRGVRIGAASSCRTRPAHRSGARRRS